jgi:hypothetical protein
MKNKILLLILGIFFLFQINFIFSSNASSADYSVNSYTTGISVSTLTSDNLAGTSGAQNSQSLSSASIYICGDGICNSGEDCSSCSADCGCSSGDTCNTGTCTANSVTTPASGAGGSSGSGGSSGNTIINFPPELFSLSLEQINIKIGQGQVKTQEITITNNQNSDLTIYVSTSKISDFLRIKESQFTLKAGESKILKLEVIALKENTPDLYLGEIIFKAGMSVKKILAAIEVESMNPLFDVAAEIPPQFLWIIPGKELYSKIDLYNLGGAGHAVDVNIEYRITDLEGDEILHSTEEVAVNTKLSFVKEFIIPPETKLGRYVLYVKITYSGLVASASTWFNVGKQTQTPLGWPTIIGITALIGAIIANIWNFRKIKKDKYTYKVGESDLKEAGIIKK